MDEKAGLLARLGIGGGRPPESVFQVDRSGVLGQIKLKVSGDDGQIITLERQKIGDEIKVLYYPGLTCLYRYDGVLRRIYCRFSEYLPGLAPELKEGLPLVFAELIGYLKRTRSELILYMDISGGFTRVMFEGSGQSWRIDTLDLKSVIGDLIGGDFQPGKGRPSIKVNFILSHERENLYYVGVGVNKVVVGSPVLETIDIGLLKGGVTEDVAKKMLSAGKQVKVSFRS